MTGFMTQNNLREHLNWLLLTECRIPMEKNWIVRPSPTTRSTVSAAAISTTPVTEPEGHYDAVEASQNLEFQRKAIASQVKRRAESEEMVNLQSGPKSSKTSGLLSQSAIPTSGMSFDYPSRSPNATSRRRQDLDGEFHKY
jgi:hypothetical protein